jgi:hypothetical protein
MASKIVWQNWTPSAEDKAEITEYLCTMAGIPFVSGMVISLNRGSFGFGTPEVAPVKVKPADLLAEMAQGMAALRAELMTLRAAQGGGNVTPKQGEADASKARHAEAAAALSSKGGNRKGKPRAA